MGDLAKGVTFIDGVSIANAASLNALVDAGTILPEFISAKSNLASPSTGCEIVVNDAGTLKKVTIANLATVITGGTGADIHAKTAITTLSDNDEFIVYEDTAAAERKITYNDLIAVLEDDLDINPGPTILTGTLTHDPSSISGNSGQEFSVTVTGASQTNTPAVFASTNYDLWNSRVGIYSLRVSAANTALVGYWNYSGSSVNLPSHTIRVVVFQY